MPDQERAVTAVIATVGIAIGILIFGALSNSENTGTKSRNDLDSYNTSSGVDVSTNKDRRQSRQGADAIVENVRYIEFPSGRKVEVHFGRAPRVVNSSDLPSNIADAYESLSNRVDRGDSFAALLLHHSLSVCEEFPIRSASELESEIDRVQQTQTVRRGSGSDQYSANALPTAVRDIEWTYRFCDGLTDEQRVAGSVWLRRAAELGHPLAIKYLVGTQIGNTAEGRALLQSAFDGGFYDTIGTLGLYLIGSDRTPYKPSAGESPYEDYDNNVLGYAYYYLYLKLVDADGKFSSSARKMFETYKEEMIDPYVVERERQLGIELAEKILLEHQNCCLSVMDVGTQD